MLKAFLLLLLICGTSHGDWYSSIGHMEELMHRELDILSYFKQYIADEEEKLAHAKAVMEQVSAEVTEAVADAEGHLSHPVNQYFLMKRLNLEFQMFDQLIEKDDDVLNEILKLRQEFPNENDVEGCAKAILRLQKTYKLDTQQLADGIVRDTDSGKSLTADDCYKIGKVACNDGDYLLCSSWFGVSYKKIYEGDTTHEWSDVLQGLANVYYELGQVEKAAETTLDILNVFPDNAVLRANYEYYNQLLKDNTTDAKGLHEPVSEGKSEDIKLYERLCREGGETVPAEIQVKLKCYYWSNNHAYMLLQPIKMEEMWHSPHIVRFYDIISDKEIDIIKNLAKPNLNRATVHNPVTSELENVDYRVSKTAWLEDSDDESVRRVTQRISMVTGLSMETAELMQISNYGVGGQYEPHTDHSRRKETEMEFDCGNRIATMLFYLSNIGHGGATVFLNPKIAAVPIKGSAVFWYNLYPSGKGDIRTKHAACPVLTGVKWVANKWIHEFGQEFRRPCRLDKGADNRIY